MKKIILVAMMVALACSSTFAKAKKSSKKAKSSVRIAMVTDSGDITDQSFNQTTYQACKITLMQTVWTSSITNQQEILLLTVLLLSMLLIRTDTM